jgi:hypothetical protein
MSQNTVNQTITVFFFFRRIAKNGNFEHLKPTKSLTLFED